MKSIFSYIKSYLLCISKTTHFIVIFNSMNILEDMNLFAKGMHRGTLYGWSQTVKKQSTVRFISTVLALNVSGNQKDDEFCANLFIVYTVVKHLSQKYQLICNHR